MQYGVFSGNPRTEWLTEAGADRRMRLMDDFTYVDPDGRLWRAPRGSVIDGASIPAALWTIVGSPYTGEYRRASVVHDVACDTPAVARRDADRMFYYACLAGGCSVDQARLLYAGVRIGAAIPNVRVWNENPELPATKKGKLRPTLADESIQNTFQEIAVDLSQREGEMPFGELEQAVDRHLQAKAQL